MAVQSWGRCLGLGKGSQGLLWGLSGVWSGLNFHDSWSRQLGTADRGRVVSLLEQRLLAIFAAVNNCLMTR
jgi:hypothetical protein